MLASSFVVIGFDGLRPDLISEAQTPNIVRLQKHGLTLGGFRTIYPSDTRAAFPSFVTGTTTSRHGSVANRFIDRNAGGILVDTKSASLIDSLDERSGGRFLTAETLGETLASKGGSLAILSTDSAGSTRILNHKAAQLRQITLSGHYVEAGTPADFIEKVVADLGQPPPPPPQGTPDLVGQSYLTSAFLNHVWPRARPTVTMIWYSEPDWSSHFCGTGASETLEGIRYADKELGRILEWWDAEGRAEGVQLCVVSDHGHITGHANVSVAGTLRATGLTVDVVPSFTADAIVIPGQVGLIYINPQSPHALKTAVDALMEQPWCGPLFTKGRNEIDGSVPGTLSSALLMADHSRAPDIYFAFRADDELDDFGLPGRCYFDGERPPGLGVHGGLHSRELAAVGIFAGEVFRAGEISSVPAGVCDVAPTMLRALGIEQPASMTGRVLTEAFASTVGAEAPKACAEVFAAGHGLYGQAIRRIRVGSALYLDGGWAGPDARERANEGGVSVCGSQA